jgi:hypothetical protein
MPDAVLARLKRTFPNAPDDVLIDWRYQTPRATGGRPRLMSWACPSTTAGTWCAWSTACCRRRGRTRERVLSEHRPYHRRE